jgi:pimeloyl-ACP methyl ester carboxylesterase
MKAIFTILLLSTAIQFAPANAAPSCAIDTNAPRDAARYDGKRFTVQIEGKGPDVILIPGLSTPRDVWDQTVQSLARCYTVHSVNIRGFGDRIPSADKPDIKTQVNPNIDGPLLEAFVQDLAAYIRNHNMGHPAIIGHSFGGLTALMIGARHPDLAGKIMVVDALPFIGTIFNPSATVSALKPQAEAMAAQLRSSYQAEIASFDGKDPGERSVAGFYSNTPSGRLLVAKWTHYSDARVSAQALLDDMTTDLRGELPKITAPVTLLYAQDDTAMTRDAATAAFVPQYAGTPVFEAEMISGSRHFIMLDQPEEFLSALNAFLKK